jgi:molecular chaperone DnaK
MRCSQIKNQNCDGAADRLPIKRVGQGSRDCIKEFQKKFGADIRRKPKMQARIMKKCEAAKIRLTSYPLATISISEADGIHDLFETITRAQFEQLCEPLFDRCIAPVRAALIDAHVTAKQVDRIVLVGGTSQIPRIRTLLEETFGAVVHQGVDPRLAVARGAALWAERIKKGKLNLPIPSFYDIVPVSLAIVTAGGVIEFMIRKGTEVSARRPIVTTTTFWVGQTNQTFSLLDICAGERKLSKYCRKVQSFYLSG